MISEKKGSILYTLEILKAYSDEQHLLTYEMISDKLYHGYGLEIERKTIARDIAILQEFGYDVVKKGNRGLYLGFRDFEEGELLYLIDAIYSSKSMPTKYAKDLVERLTKNHSNYKKKKYKYLEKIDDGARTDNKEIFWTIELLNEAIEKKKKVEFQYGAYGIDKKIKLKGDGKFYKINPYFMVNNKGKYYLVCNYDKYDDVSNYKIECISNIKILDEDIKPITELPSNKDFSVKDYVKEHVYMAFGESVDAEIRIASEEKINDFIDWFGKDSSIFKKGDDIVATLKVNEESLIFWALQYGQHVEVLKPIETREKIKKILNGMVEKYNK
ncbi:MAG: WYL domain-containing transcriptional regulator [Clostridia bacterium]|nr:WYL domain-containing transcriptional regulator [Clostridia bacterium]